MNTLSSSNPSVFQLVSEHHLRTAFSRQRWDIIISVPRPLMVRGKRLRSASCVMESSSRPTPGDRNTEKKVECEEKMPVMAVRRAFARAEDVGRASLIDFSNE
jgi:hypothetical protein